MTIRHISDDLDDRPDSAIRSGLCDEIARLRESNDRLIAALQDICEAPDGARIKAAAAITLEKS